MMYAMRSANFVLVAEISAAYEKHNFVGHSATGNIHSALVPNLVETSEVDSTGIEQTISARHKSKAIGQVTHLFLLLFTVFLL
jgi:hypothetical protein